jgi:hypothetical protein
LPTLRVIASASLALNPSTSRTVFLIFPEIEAHDARQLLADLDGCIHARPPVETSGIIVTQRLRSGPCDPPNRPGIVPLRVPDRHL